MILKLICLVFVSLLGRKCYEFVMNKKHRTELIEDRNLVMDISEYLNYQNQMPIIAEVIEPIKKIEVKEACIEGTDAELFYENLISEVESLFIQDEEVIPSVPEIVNEKETWIARVIDVAFTNVLFEIEDTFTAIDLGKRANELLRNDVVMLDVLVNPLQREDFTLLIYII